MKTTHVSNLRRSRAFSISDLTVLLAIVGLLATLALTSCGLTAARRNANMMKNSTQVRSILQTMLTFANSNRGVLPGMRQVQSEPPEFAEPPAADIELSEQGGHAVESRYALLLKDNYFEGDVLISPVDGGKQAWTAGLVTTANYSYAMLQIDEPGARQRAWTGLALGATTPFMCDRLSAGNPGEPQTYQSIWSTRAGEWQGTIGFADVHTEFVSSPTAPSGTSEDDIFSRDGPDDADMVYSGK